MTNDTSAASGLDLEQYQGVLETPAFVLYLADHEETIALGQMLGHALYDALSGHDLDNVFVGLVGGLGAGKTTLMQGFVSAFAEDAEATSPTYALVNVYELGFPVVHMDLYRLENFDDLESIGYWDYVESGGHVLCVEWIDQIPQAWPGNGVLMLLTRCEGGRQLRMWGSQGYTGILSEVCEAFGRYETASK